MASLYALPTFLRQTPSSLLANYFNKHNILTSFDFTKLKRTTCDLLIQEMQPLSEAWRATIDADFQNIHLLANAGGTALIQDEAALRGLEIADDLGKLENAYARAMWLFLNHNRGRTDLFPTCLAIAKMKTLSFTRSRQRKNFPKVEPKYDLETLAALTTAIQAHYRAQGRGYHCKVIHFSRPNPTRNCFLAFPEDYSTSELQYQGEDLKRQSRRSVFDVAFVFRPDEGLLEVAAPGQRKEIEALQRIFASITLGIPDLPAPQNNQTFNLQKLLSSDFTFPTAPKDKIERVEIASLRLVVQSTPEWKITVEQERGSDEFIEGLEELIKVPIDDLKVIQAKLRVTWTTTDSNRARTLTFTLTAPDATDLSDHPHHRTVKDYLQRWGLMG